MPDQNENPAPVGAGNRAEIIQNAPTMLEQALDYASRGWQVFPCKPGAKTPLTTHGRNDGATSKEIIEQWWLKWPSANIGIATGKESGLAVLDFDVKKGQPGASTFKALQAEHGQLLTCMSQTPSGGWHLLYQHPGGKVKTCTDLLPGLDIRGDGGYIVVPGSTTAEGAYTWVTDEPPAPLPDGLKRLLTQDKKPKGNGEAPPFDRGSVLDGVPEGQRDDALYRYICSLQGSGVKEPEARVLATHAAANCRPPFAEAEALAKVGRVYQQFAAETVPAAWQQPNLITPDEWGAARITPDCIVENYLFADVATLNASGGSGKTTLILYEAVHIVLGMPLYGLEVYRPGPVVIVTAEDSREMLVARLRKICDSLGLSPADIQRVRDQVRISDVSGETFRITEVVSDTVCISKNVTALSDGMRDLAPVLVVLDPAVSFGVGESRVNDAEQGLINAARRLRRDLNCCVRYVHHTGKGNARDKVTDQYAGRGGSALPDGARMVHVLQPMDAAEWLKATGTELDPGDSGLFLARPKMSYCPPQGEILLRRAGYAFEHIDRVDRDPMTELRRDAETVLNLVREIDRPTQNTLQVMDTGLSRDRTRAVVRHLLDQGQLIYQESSGTKRGAHKFLETTGAPWKDEPRGDRAATNFAAVSARAKNSSRCAAAYRDSTPRAPTRGGVHPVALGERDIKPRTDRAPAHRGGIPPEIYEAATTACSGLKLTAGEFIAQLEPEDYPEIISNPAVARATAQSMDARK